ncbi:hypothetical protein A2U01_0098786, partial [Trifolium medium]|nr:hypothetical protein [Trifolium medium]
CRLTVTAAAAPEYGLRGGSPPEKMKIHPSS